jgi:hypothetical protein
MVPAEVIDLLEVVLDLLEAGAAPTGGGCALEAAKKGESFEGAAKTMAEAGSAWLRTTTGFEVADGRRIADELEATGWRVITLLEIAGLSVITPLEVPAGRVTT